MNDNFSVLIDVILDLASLSEQLLLFYLPTTLLSLTHYSVEMNDIPFINVSVAINIDLANIIEPIFKCRFIKIIELIAR